MEYIWTEWLDNLTDTLEDYILYAGAAFLLFYVVLKDVLKNRRIQAKFPKFKDYRREFFYSMITIGIFATVALFVFDVGYEYTNMYDSISDRGMTWYVLSYMWMFFLHDAYFYWIHRFMHLPALYNRVHLLHHKSTNPSPWTAYAFHPLEAVLEAGIIPLIAFTVPVQREALVWFFLFQIAYNVYIHLGYELWPKNFHKTLVGRYVNTSVAHNVHHRYFRGNYGLYTLIWDRLLGTMNTRYDEVYEATTDRANAAAPPNAKFEPAAEAPDRITP